LNFMIKLYHKHAYAHLACLQQQHTRSPKSNLATRRTKERERA
jgi:hypothetical protein